MDNVHFEVHQTLKFDKHSGIDDARRICDKRGIKLIEVHALSKNAQNVLLIDPMTSFRFNGTYNGLKEYIQETEFELACIGVHVVREKIEIPPFEYIGNLSTLYYESHLQVILNKRDPVTEMNRLASTIPSCAHLSKNAFKSSDKGVHVMVTIRSKYDTKTLQKRLNLIKSTLRRNRFFLSDKIEVEKVVYDTKIHHDNIWING